MKWELAGIHCVSPPFWRAKVNFAQWAAYQGAISTWPAATAAPTAKRTPFSAPPPEIWIFSFAILPASNASYIDSISIAGKGDSRKRAKGKVKNPLRIIFPDIFFWLLSGSLLCGLDQRQDSKLGLLSKCYIKMALCLRAILLARGRASFKKGCPNLKTYCWQQHLWLLPFLLSLLLLLLLSLLIKSSLGVTALLIRRLLLLGVASLPWGAARLLLHLINDEL